VSESCETYVCCVRDTDEELECLSNPAGRGYIGSVNVSATGKPCVPWTEVPTDLCYDVSVDALNYCRYIPDQQWPGTYCGVRTKTGVQLERCNVPYCGGNIAYCITDTDTVLCDCEDDLQLLLLSSVFDLRGRGRWQGLTPTHWMRTTLLVYYLVLFLGNLVYYFSLMCPNCIFRNLHVKFSQKICEPNYCFEIYWRHFCT